jgi:hypothetical protein
MRVPRLAWWIFFIGLVPFMFATDPLRASLGDWLSFAVAIAYLVLLRLTAELIERKYRPTDTESGRDT